MKTLQSFLPHILPSVVGCSEPLAIQCLRDTAIDFAERTNVWWSWFTVGSEAGVQEYDVDLPTQARLVRVLAAFYLKTKMRANDVADVDDPFAIRGQIESSEPDSGEPTAIHAVPGGGTFLVYPLPESTVADAFTIRASYAPTDTATSLDDLFYTRYLQAMKYGTLARLYGTAGQGFTSPAMEDREMRKYMREVGRAVREARKGATQTSTRVKARAFA